MKKWILLLLACLLIQSARADVTDGQETQNGGGAAEQNFAYALAILKPLLKMCEAASSVCVSSYQQRALVLKIYASLDQELENDVLLRFESGKTNPAKFQLDGQVRIASTGLSIGSTIYINRDLIYRQNGAQVIPYTVNEALGVLVHELGHHQGVLDHDVLDILGGKVRSFFELKQDRLTIDTFSDYFNEANISLSVFHTRQQIKPHAHASLFWLNVGDRVFDINDEIESKLKCPVIPGSINNELVGFRFSNMHWGDRSEDLMEFGAYLLYPLEALVWLECKVTYESGNPYYLANRYRARMLFPFQPAGHSLSYIEDNLSIFLMPIQEQ